MNTNDSATSNVRQDSNPMLSAALAWAARRLPCLSTQSLSTAPRRIKAGRGRATNDVAWVAKLFRQPATATTSVWRCGGAAILSSIWTRRTGITGIAAFEALELQHTRSRRSNCSTRSRRLPEYRRQCGPGATVNIASTGSPAILLPRCSVGKLGDGIDIKCKGGYVVAAGSAGYFLASGGAPFGATPPLPDWLDALCRQRD